MNQPYEVTFSMQLATSETSPNRQKGLLFLLAILKVIQSDKRANLKLKKIP